MFKREDVKLIAIGIVVSAYMTIVYDIVQEFAKTPIDSNEIMIKAAAGLVSAGIGVVILYYLTSKKSWIDNLSKLGCLKISNIFKKDKKSMNLCIFQR